MPGQNKKENQKNKLNKNTLTLLQLCSRNTTSRTNSILDYWNIEYLKNININLPSLLYLQWTYLLFMVAYSLLLLLLRYQYFSIISYPVRKHPLKICRLVLAFWRICCWNLSPPSQWSQTISCFLLRIKFDLKLTSFLLKSVSFCLIPQKCLKSF